MKKFTLVMNATPAKRIVEGKTLNEACKKAGLTKEDLECLEYFIEDSGKIVHVFGLAKCKCDGYAKDGVTCIHDLARVGINYIAENG